MLTVKEIKNNTNTECNSCGKKRKRYFEIRYGIRIPDFPWQPYSTLPLCASCMKKLGARIENKLETFKEEAVKPVVNVDEWVCGCCGSSVEQQRIFHPNAIFHDFFEYCPHCGKKVDWEAVRQNDES